MNQIVHIFRKDCRRLWRTILVVLLFTILHAYGDTFTYGGRDVAIGLSPRALLFMLVGLSGFLLPIMLFFLIISVIQEESLVGSDKFWLTRPYSRRSLAIEKFLFVLLFAFLPMLLHDAWLVRHYDFSLSSASGLLLWKDSQFAFFLVITATFAVLSANLGRAVLAAVAAIFSAVFIFSIVLQGSSGGPSAEGSATLLFLTIFVLAAIGALCVIVFQYRFRITPVAALIGVLAIFACALLARFWPSSLAARLSNPYSVSELSVVQLMPDASLTGLTRPPELDSRENQAHTVYYPFRVEGLAHDVSVALNSAYGDFSAPGQGKLSFTLALESRFQPANSAGQFADPGGPAQLVAFTARSLKDTEPLPDTAGALSGKINFEAFRAFVVRIPLPAPYKPQKFAIAGRRCSVEAGQRDGRLILWFNCVELEPGNTSRMQVHLLQGDQEIIPQGTSGQTSGQGGWPAFASPILRNVFSFEFSPPASADVLSSGSPQGREMLIFEEESLGKEERSFRIDNFRPGDLTLEAWKQRRVLVAPQHHLAPFVLPPRPHK